MLSIALFAAVTILGPANPQVWEKTAADELKAYLERRLGENDLVVGGVTNPVFQVGDTEEALKRGIASKGFKDEEWSILSRDGMVFLNGGGRRGCLYAVWHFLEDECGVRFWGDTEEDVPGPSVLVLKDLKRRGKPFFAYRDVYRSGHAAEADPRTAARRRLNRNGDVKIPVAYGDTFDYGGPYFIHALGHWVPWETYGKEHPEWFAFRNGKHGGDPDHIQHCQTNPELMSKLVELIDARIDKDAAEARAAGRQAPHYYDLTHRDNESYCLCANCLAAEEKYGRSGIMLRFANEIAGRVGKRHPEVKFRVCAYQFTEEVPKCAMRAADNVIVDFCNTTGNKVRPIQHNSNSFFRNKLVEWSRFTDNILVAEYSVTYSKDSLDYPLANELHFADEFAYFATNRAKSVFLEHERPSTSDLFDIKYYLETRLMEDPFLDGDALVRQTFREYFGPEAGERMLALRRRMRDNAEKYQAIVTWFPVLSEFLYHLRDEDVAFARQTFAAAEAATRKDAKLFRRVLRARTGWDAYAARQENLLVRIDGGWETPASKFLVEKREKNAWHVRDPEFPDGEVVRIDTTAAGYGMPLYFNSYNIFAEQDSSLPFTPVSGRIKDVPADGKYHWVSLGKVDMKSAGWYVNFGEPKRVRAFLKPLPGVEGKKYDVRLQLKRSGKEMFLSRLRLIEE